MNLSMKPVVFLVMLAGGCAIAHPRHAAKVHASEDTAASSARLLLDAEADETETRSWTGGKLAAAPKKPSKVGNFFKSAGAALSKAASAVGRVIKAAIKFVKKKVSLGINTAWNDKSKTFAAIGRASWSVSDKEATSVLDAANDRIRKKMIAKESLQGAALSAKFLRDALRFGSKDIKRVDKVKDFLTKMNTGLFGAASAVLFESAEYTYSTDTMDSSDSTADGTANAVEAVKAIALQDAEFAAGKVASIVGDAKSKRVYLKQKVMARAAKLAACQMLIQTFSHADIAAGNEPMLKFVQDSEQKIRGSFQGSAGSPPATPEAVATAAVEPEPAPPADAGVAQEAAVAAADPPPDNAAGEPAALNAASPDATAEVKVPEVVQESAPADGAPADAPPPDAATLLEGQALLRSEMLHVAEAAAQKAVRRFMRRASRAGP